MYFGKERVPEGGGCDTEGSVSKSSQFSVEMESNMLYVA